MKNNQVIDYKQLMQYKQNNNIQLIVNAIKSPNFSLDSLFPYIDIRKYKRLNFTANLNENKLKILRYNDFTLKLFASSVAKQATKEYKYWQRYQIQILADKYMNSTNINNNNTNNNPINNTNSTNTAISNTNTTIDNTNSTTNNAINKTNNINNTSSSSPPLPSFYIKNTPYRPNKAAPIFDAKLNGLINGYIVSRVLFDKDHAINLDDDLSVYCEWFARYADPEHILLIIIDIDDTLINLTESLEQFKQLWSTKSNIIIGDHIQCQIWINSRLMRSNNNYDCCKLIEKQLFKLLNE